jgi:hypothetical protein
MEKRIVETADAIGRTSSAAKSLKRWFDKESSTLRRAIEIAREHLAAHPGDGETRESLHELERQQADLYAGWKRSSLRKHIEEREDGGGEECSGEHRAVLAAPSGSSLAHEGRATETSATMTAKSVQGYGATFNKFSVNLGGFIEKIAPGAFANALKKSDVSCLFNHDWNFIFGRSTAHTLELREDSQGLWFSCALLPFDGVSFALARRIDRLDVPGCSFSFTVARDTWKFAPRPGGLDERTLLEIDELFDVGPVCRPAYPSTSVSAIFAKAARTAPAVFASAQRTAPTTTSTRRQPATLAGRLYAQRQLDQARFEWERRHWNQIQKEKRYWLAMGLSEQAAAKKIDLLFQKHLS